MNASYPIPTADGTFWAGYSDRGLAVLRFPQGSPTSTPPIAAPRWHPQTVSAVRAILDAKEPADLPPLDLSGGTEFQRQVWQILQSIFRGRTMSYGEIAVALGKPGAARAVGSACGANPIPLLIPCHRVLAANRMIGGFSGGLGWKEKLLALEQVPFKTRLQIQQGEFSPVAA